MTGEEGGAAAAARWLAWLAGVTEAHPSRFVLAPR